MKRATDPGLDAIALEPPYRGAGQTAIGRLLDQYGVPSSGLVTAGESLP